MASMNIRDKFLTSKECIFKEAGLNWHNNPLFKMESILDSKRNDVLEENEIYLGLTVSPLIHLNDLKLGDSSIDPDLLIFASRHRSETERPAFLAHTTGNWADKADFGGNPRELSTASALLLKAGLLSLIEQAKTSSYSNFSLDIEVSHHGPTTLEKPLIFMELGSSEKEWVIDDAGKVVSSAVINTVLKYLELQKQKEIKVGIGFGGMHYAPQFKKLIMNKNIAVSFICPKYFVQKLNRDMIEQMINKNLEQVDYFIIDWKGTNSADKQHLVPLLEEFDVPIKKTKEF
jgi:D-aminoacyl-tRNA deacylase